jgi:hypothetical protein
MKTKIQKILDTYPREIFLNGGNEEELLPYYEFSGVTLSSDEAETNNVRYIRADISQYIAVYRDSKFGYNLVTNNPM